VESELERIKTGGCNVSDFDPKRSDARLTPSQIRAALLPNMSSLALEGVEWLITLHEMIVDLEDRVKGVEASLTSTGTLVREAISAAMLPEEK
jgi:hypothetical protein